MLHSTISLFAGSTEHSPLHQLKISHGRFLHFKENTFFNSVNNFTNSNHVLCLSLIWWYLSINELCDCCNALYLDYGHNVTFNFDYTLSWFNDYFAAHKKVNGSWSGGFLPDVYQIWDEVIWLTSEKGCLLSNAPICWEQIEPSSEVSQQLYYNYWKQLGFLPQEMCNIHIPLFSNPSSVPPFAWPGTRWTGSLSHTGLLQMRPTGYVALTHGHGFPLTG